MRPAPARRPVLRRPPTRLVAAVIVALACGALVLQVTGRAEAAAVRYGATTGAWVASADLHPGARIGAGDVVVERRPSAFVPDGAIDADPTGRRVAHLVSAGEVVAEHRLAGGDRRGVASLVPEGWRAVAVPAVDGVLPVEVGQRVDVIAAVDTEAGPDGAVVAEDGIVVHLADDSTITVAVERGDASQVVAALAGGYVALALVG